MFMPMNFVDVAIHNNCKKKPTPIIIATTIGQTMMQCDIE
jgi:hypothetical protein